MGFHTYTILTTPLTVTTYADLSKWVWKRPAQQKPLVVDFTNTHIVTLRRHDREFADATSTVDHFIPDGMPLIWLLNQQGAHLQDRVYGPEFTRQCLANSPTSVRHYFLGGSQNCLEKLISQLKLTNPSLHIVGSHNGYFSTADEDSIISSITAVDPDCVWVGLGTPKQQILAKKLKLHMTRGVIFSVGFAFDVIAKTKEDAPTWMQTYGLTWLFRLSKEPRRLTQRYLKYNTLFLWYLLRDSICSSSKTPRKI